MAGLKGKTVADAYKSLLRVNDDSNGITTGVLRVTDGEGTNSCLFLSDDALLLVPNNDDTTSSLGVLTTGGTTIFSVDTTNQLVKAGAGQFNVLTQYVNFGVNYIDFSNCAANTHYPVPFGGSNGGGTTTNDVSFGTSGDPATTFTVGDVDTNYAAQITPMLWYIPDNISVDAVYSIHGADNATGDTTRMHLMSYDYTSGASAALTNGTLLASNSDQVNAGNEQTYLHTWSLESDTTVASGKVVLAFFESDSVNSDYSINITVKYHLV
jgi:hypothetical protein